MSTTQKLDARAGVAEIVRMIDSKTSYFIGKSLDVFYRLPEQHRVGILSFFSDKIKFEPWKALLEDDTLHIDLARSVLMYHTGRGERGQPCVEDLRTSFLEYLRSDDFAEAEREWKQLKRRKSDAKD